MDRKKKIPADYIQKVYAGLLGKSIGVRQGANIEGFTYDRIQKIFGEIHGYTAQFKRFAADDDLNGPVFMVRALEDYGPMPTAREMGKTLLNYAPYEHGYFWWGGYGISTEHTAYLNLRAGIEAPASGSIAQNGKAVAEQIGGQIFVDTWGLVAPGDWQLAAKLAGSAASVTHDGEGINGGRFIAACISAAFVKKSISEVLRCGLSVIPESSQYARVVRAVWEFHDRHPEDWRGCFAFVKKEYGYHLYPGNCHIIPNTAVIILSLLYGKVNFSDSINIACMCGWDTDCNAGNVGTIVGVLAGLENIGWEWRRPIEDTLVFSSVIGGLNLQDLAGIARYVAGLGYGLAKEAPDAKISPLFSKDCARYHFELPGSTQGFTACVPKGCVYTLEQSTMAAASGSGSLRFAANGLSAGDEPSIYARTYFYPEDFSDSRYDPAFTPIVFPGQKITARMMAETGCPKVKAAVFACDVNGAGEFLSQWVSLKQGEFSQLELKIPAGIAACIDRIGVKLRICENSGSPVVLYLDEVNFGGKADYTVDFARERVEKWSPMHREISQFTQLKGLWDIENGELSGSCADFGEIYTGGYGWEDYRFSATLIPKRGQRHRLNFRVQGAVRCYAVGLDADGKLSLYKNTGDYQPLCAADFPWEPEQRYRVTVEAIGNHFRVFADDQLILDYTDHEKPYLHGQVGFSVFKGSHCHFSDLCVKEL